ncbi:MAG: hypothetical protein O9972_55105 [Burkholderiales bacterium]|nr:hypothetical protein [Burkholderiales bacterium]
MVHGLSGPRVVDCSIMPRFVFGNPTITRAMKLPPAPSVSTTVAR